MLSLQSHLNPSYSDHMLGASMSFAPIAMVSFATYTLGDVQIEAAANQVKALSALLDKSAEGPDYTPMTQIEGEADFGLKTLAYMMLCYVNGTYSTASSDFPQDQQTQQWSSILLLLEP